MSEATVHEWKARFGGMDISDAKRPKGLEENAKRKRLLADAAGASGHLARGSPIVVPQAANQRWSLDFVSDQMTDGAFASWP